MERMIRIEVRLESDGSREARQVEIAAIAAAKAAMVAILRTSGLKVTETSSDSFPTEQR